MDRGKAGVFVAGALIALVLLAACGGNKGVKSCDKPQRYQESASRERVKTPDDLDELDRQRELPVPEANPTGDRPPGSPCLDLPPRIMGSG